MDIEKVRSRFIKHFDGQTGNIYMSPGRINLIGEHTDYNGGYVFPGAVDKGIMAEIRPNGTNTIMLYSVWHSPSTTPKAPALHGHATSMVLCARCSTAASP